MYVCFPKRLSTRVRNYQLPLSHKLKALFINRALWRPIA